MAEITAAMVKDLRERTGVGMMDCKAALKENDGDIDAAIDWLRTKGLAKAAKKAGRVAAEGLVGIAAGGSSGAVVEVNSETDFVARNADFQKMVATVATIALETDGDTEAVAAAQYPGSDRSVQDYIAEQVGTIGENLSLRRTERLTVGQGAVASYIHNQTAPGLGKIGVLVALNSAADVAELNALGRQIAMHVAATSPLAVSPDRLDPDVVARERAVLSDQARESGKPEAIIEKMVEGRIRKYYEEVVLLSQPFVIDPDNTVGEAVEAKAKELGAAIEVVDFVRFALGEGIDKDDDDFAAEVRAAAGG